MESGKLPHFEVQTIIRIFKKCGLFNLRTMASCTTLNLFYKLLLNSYLLI